MARRIATGLEATFKTTQLAANNIAFEVEIYVIACHSLIVCVNEKSS
jgi:hypothetical protein